MTHTTQREMATPVAVLLPCALSLLRWWAAALLFVMFAGLLALLYGWAREWESDAFLTLLLVVAILLALHAIAVLAALMIVVGHIRSQGGDQAREDGSGRPFGGLTGVEDRLLIGE